MQLVWSSRAQQDISEIFTYIHEHNRDAALYVVDTIEGTVKLLKHQPRIGRLGRVKFTREMIIPKTKYIVVYRIGDGQIDILSVMHGAQDWPESF